MGVSRKYNLNISDVMSCGIGSVTGNTITCSILDPFSVTYDTNPPTICNYPLINLDDLKALSTINYENRISDLINKLQIENESSKESLIEDAQYEELDCDYKSDLSTNFIVYKFLSGIRIINAGSPSGIIEYKVYPVGGDPNNYPWVTNPTFLNLDPDGIYIVLIRDNLNNLILDTHSTTISMQLLLPSTTTTLASKTISLNQINTSTSLFSAYKNGCVQINPQLSSFERLEIDFTTNTIISGCGEFSLTFTCKPNNSSQFYPYCNIVKNTVGTSSSSGNLSIEYGDTVCYNIMGTNNAYGSTVCGDFCINNVNGLNTVNPIIDITNNCSTIVKITQPLDIVVSLSGITTTNTTNSQIVNGVVKFSQSIPNGEFINIQFSAANSVSASGTFSSTEIFRKRTIDSNYVSQCVIGNICSQPQTLNLIACNGDKYCFNMVINLISAGNTGTNSISITNINSSSGVLSSISTGNTISFTKSIPIPSVVFGVCRQNSTPSSSNGYFNITPSLPNGEYVTLGFQINQDLFGSSSSNISYYCKPNGCANFVLKCQYSLSSSCSNTCNRNGNITINSGDCLCYTNSLSNKIVSQFTFTTICSSSGISPSICSGKNGDYLLCT
jgi:hypothetical protein